jgi:uncharacterized alpha-E superfamily protein
MLGSTAGGLFWMFRYLERSENIARLIDAGLRIALTQSSRADDEWTSVLTTTGALESYRERHEVVDGQTAIDFLLRDEANPSSVLAAVNGARHNARAVRTALTREVWEATNDAWMELTAALSRPVVAADLPRLLRTIRQEGAHVRGALHGTMIRNEIFNFSRLGTFVERADNTARILDVKYYVLLPSPLHVGSRLDAVQWDTILRSVSAQRAYHWQYPGDVRPTDIAHFLILNHRMPRSLAYSFNKIQQNLTYLARDYNTEHLCQTRAAQLQASVSNRTISSIFEEGLHEFLGQRIADTGALAAQIESDYRFYE